jgi:very-short-patch-repair endonuclease
MWIVHSLNPSTDLKVGDLRRLLIEHAQDPKAALKEGIEAASRAESEFEIAVIKRLSDAGYYLRTQYEVGSYRIDIVVIGTNGERLAVECDGARYHGPAELDRDMQRQADLERLDWRFVRIRGTDFYRNPDAAMQPVFERLASLGIEPLQHVSSGVQLDETSELLERVRRRGQEILGETERAFQVGGLLVQSRSPRRGGGFSGNAKPGGSSPLFDLQRPPAESSSTRAEGTGNGIATRPNIEYRASIDEHTTRTLLELAKWQLQRNRFADALALARAISRELGYQRFGPRIETRLLSIARRAMREARDGPDE